MALVARGEATIAIGAGKFLVTESVPRRRPLKRMFGTKILSKGLTASSSSIGRYEFARHDNGAGKPERRIGVRQLMDLADLEV